VAIIRRPYSGTNSATDNDKRKTGHLKVLNARSFLVKKANEIKKSRLIIVGTAITQNGLSIKKEKTKAPKQKNAAVMAVTFSPYLTH
jgi:hypothetical protein